MRRREFVSSLAALAAPSTPYLMTVRGPSETSSLGTVLTHEHLFSMFGEEPSDHFDYNRQALRAAVIPYLEELRDHGCSMIIDGTAARFGREPALLRELSSETGIQVVTNTGFYGAAGGRYIPAAARQQTAPQIAESWLTEWRDGIQGTGIRPGFIKMGVNAGRLTPVDRTLLQAAAIAHKASGLTIAVHTGDNPVAVQEQLDLLRAGGVAPEAWVWIHANQCKQHDAVIQAARAGAWVSLDGLAIETLESHLELCNALRQADLLRRVLLSHDGNSFRSNGLRPMKAYSALFTHFLPRLKLAGYSTAELRALTIENPAQAYSVRVRRLPQ